MGNAHTGDTPFFHLRLEHFFPDDLYSAMLRVMPVSFLSDYRAMPEPTQVNGAEVFSGAQGTATYCSPLRMTARPLRTGRSGEVPHNSSLVDD